MVLSVGEYRVMCDVCGPEGVEVQEGRREVWGHSGPPWGCKCEGWGGAVSGCGGLSHAVVSGDRGWGCCEVECYFGLQIGGGDSGEGRAATSCHRGVYIWGVGVVL